MNNGGATDKESLLYISPLAPQPFVTHIRLGVHVRDVIVVDKSSSHYRRRRSSPIKYLSTIAPSILALPRCVEFLLFTALSTLLHHVQGQLHCPNGYGIADQIGLAVTLGKEVSSCMSDWQSLVLVSVNFILHISHHNVFSKILVPSRFLARTGNSSSR